MGSLYIHGLAKDANGTPIMGTVLTGEHKLRGSEALPSRIMGGQVVGKLLSQDSISSSLGHKSGPFDTIFQEPPSTLDSDGFFFTRITDVEFTLMLTATGLFNFSAWSFFHQPAGERIAT